MISSKMAAFSVKNLMMSRWVWSAWKLSQVRPGVLCTPKVFPGTVSCRGEQLGCDVLVSSAPLDPDLGYLEPLHDSGGFGPVGGRGKVPVYRAGGRIDADAQRLAGDSYGQAEDQEAQGLPWCGLHRHIRFPVGAGAPAPPPGPGRPWRAG